MKLIRKGGLILPYAGLRGLYWEHILCLGLCFIVGLKLHDFWWGLATFLLLEFVAIQSEKVEFEMNKEAEK